MEKMKTAEEMLQFIKKNDTGTGLSKSKCLQYLKLIEDDLKTDEYAVLTFSASHTTCYLESEGDFTSAVTNKRIIMVKQGQETVIKRIPLDEFISLTVSWGKTFASMIIDAAKTQIFMENTVSKVKTIQALFAEALGTQDSLAADTVSKSVKFLLPEGVAKLKTAAEMVKYCEVNSAELMIKREKAIDYFNLVEECLKEDESAVCAFIAKQYNQLGKAFASAITNERILIGRQELVNGRILRFIDLNELTKINVAFHKDAARIKIYSAKMELDMETEAFVGRFVEETFTDILTEPEPEEKVVGEIEEKTQDIVSDLEEGEAKTVKMRTAEEMIQYCIDHGTILENKPQKKFLDFQMAEDCLKGEEYAIMCFVGAYSETNFKGLDSTWYIGVREKDNSWACVLTNKRIIMTQKSIPPVRLKSIPYERIYDISVEVSEPYANVIISAVNGDLDIHMSAWQGCQVDLLLKDVREQASEVKFQEKREQLKNVWSYSVADEIRKFKELCDDGIITKEEFQKKKGELLNIDYMPKNGDADIIVKPNILK